VPQPISKTRESLETMLQIYSMTSSGYPLRAASYAFTILPKFGDVISSHDAKWKVFLNLACFGSSQFQWKNLNITKLYVLLVITMHLFKANPKQWGNSLGVTIPKDIIEQEHLNPNKKATFLVIGDGMDKVKEIFGTLKTKKSTQQIMDEIDEGYD
jgi:antitoxin component of MazEF toxin-antitoxin module